MAVTGRSNMTLMADVDLDSVAARDFDCVFCPGKMHTLPSSHMSSRNRDFD